MNGLATLIGASFTRPSEAAAALLGMRLSRDAAWTMLGFSVVATVLVMFGLTGGAAVPIVPALDPFSPFMAALFLGCSTIVLGYGIYFTGNAMDGKGDLTGAIIVVSWLQILQEVGLLIQAALILVSPGFGTMVGLGISFALVWVLLCFIDVLHGFGSILRAALLMLFVIVGIGLGRTLILGLIGVGL